MSATQQTIWTCNAPGCSETVAFQDPNYAAYATLGVNPWPEGWELWHNIQGPQAPSNTTLCPTHRMGALISR